MKYQHILVALELTKEDNVLISKAIAMASSFGADVSFIHVDGAVGEVYPELLDIQKDSTLKPLNKHGNDLLHQSQQRIKTEHPELLVKHFWVGTGDLSAKLKHMMKDHNYDLLICGHHHDFWSNMVSYSRNLINKSPVDILVVPIKS